MLSSAMELGTFCRLEEENAGKQFPSPPMESTLVEKRFDELINTGIVEAAEAGAAA